MSEWLQAAMAVALFAFVGWTVWSQQQMMRSLIRVERKRVGLPELEAEKKPAPEPMPETIKNLSLGFDSQHMQSFHLAAAERRFKETQSWDQVEREMRDALGIE